ncbi:MAG: hypothetical protein LLG20_18650 [Acidobacteriales bacterium]|nr:hypothetical protein [Terriglobales bacterium]
MTSQTIARPQPGVLFGITHTTDGEPIVREPKLLRVGIGHPKGLALSVWMEGGVWRGSAGYKKPLKSVRFADRKAVEKWYYEEKAKAAASEAYAKEITCPYPRKLPFFYFTRQLSDGTFEPDFDAIAAHGQMPTELDIVFLDDNPLDGAYQMWSKSELRCKGDGINAERVLTLAGQKWLTYTPAPEELELAEAARKDGLKFFPIQGGCFTCGCPYTTEYQDGRGRMQPPPCKPGGDLKFQLLKIIRVGGTAYFHTTGVRSIQNLFSGLYRIKALTGGRLAGIPLKLVMRPYRTNHNNQPAIQYGVSIEFRAEDLDALKKNLIEQALKFRQIADLPGQVLGGGRQIAAPESRMLPAPDTADPASESGATLIDDEGEGLQALAMSAEFYGATEDDGEPEGEPEPQQAGNDALKAALGAKKPQDAPPAAQSQTPAPESTQAAAPSETAPESIPTFNGEWPDAFDGPECIFNGDHMRFDEQTGNYRKVDTEAAQAPSPAPKQTQPVARRGRPARNPDAFDFGGGRK